MSLFLRRNTWWYAFTLKGKLYRGSCKTHDKVQAQEYEDTVRAKAWRGRMLGDKERRTVEEAINKFMEVAQNKRSYREDIRYAVWWKEQFRKAAVTMLDDVTPEVVNEIKSASALLKTRRGKLPAPATVNRKLAFLRTVINMAHREWLWIDQAPKFRFIPGEMERRRFLKPEEVIRLVRALPQPYADMALFSVATGLRQRNVLGLKWSQVDLGRRVITLPHEVMKNGLPFSCPLTDTAAAVVIKWVGKHEENVFVNSRNEPIKSIQTRVWIKALKGAGLEDLHWHDLRHTWASLMRQSGLGLADLQELGGWRSGSMVQRYAHLDIEHLREKASLLDGVLGAVVTQRPHKIHTAA